MAARGPAAVATLHRTSATDSLLCQALTRELELRGVRVADATAKHHVVVVSEWDTYYGRALPLTFAATVLHARQRGGTDPGGDPTPYDEHIVGLIGRGDGGASVDRLHRFSYLRGVDGVTADAGTAAGGSEDKKQAAVAAQETARERPDGTAQFDCMRRLADRIKDLNTRLERNGDGHVAAIGVLGSDVYDKLLILRALQPAFPSAVFFTTDLDNRLTDRRELDWTRNLIVASGFGLELTASLQGEIPPFREAYQTALYASCLQALDFPPVVERSPLPPTPRVFEIGRTRANDLSPNPPGGLDEKGIHPLRHVDQWPQDFNWPRYLLPLVPGLALLVLLSRRARRMVIGGSSRDRLTDDPAA